MVYDLIFVVLTYRNEKDLQDFFNSLSNCSGSTRVIVVNAYYDENSLKKVKEIAINNNADFIEIENKGYSYGNNVGIQYALEDYKFRYLVVSNPDIEIQKFNIDDLCNEQNALIGPTIITLSGKNQNPMMYRRVPLALHIEYMNQKHGDSRLLWGGANH